MIVGEVTAASQVDAGTTLDRPPDHPDNAEMSHMMRMPRNDA